ncbi:enoyl-CoA hydratase-related protein [Hoeflea sp. EC-HK425]|uniref:enoyl-CoA hydratase-related protein n=1 Tax=Hoeflea sp. EC-HK425 TaxID=2038388 RepID=UPI00125ABEFB|nr:enoyl-CoA hydratase-related protein [Hoeflea sp. EC-HK425]VVT01218.1 putative enoyl-CoA hydratase echA8 [Hoeflea sp. EC-HK425]
MTLVIADYPREHVALLRLNRPDVRNALNPELRAELRDEFDRLSDDKTIRAIIITGNSKAFAAGADIKGMVDIGAGEMMARDDERNWAAIRNCRKPVIAAIDGYALGGGCELAMHADIIVAGESAIFGQPEVRLGIMPGAGGTQRLVRAVGKHRAMLMLMTGETMTAAEAFDAGLVSKVVERDRAVAEAIKIATSIAAMPPLAVAEIKQVLLAGMEVNLDTALMLERRAAYLLFETEDKRTAMEGFINKNKPTFSGS